MNPKVVIGLGAVATLGCVAALVGGVDGLMVLVIALKLVWLAAIVTACKAREWRWAAAICVLGALPALFYVFVRFRGPRRAMEPISVFRG